MLENGFLKCDNCGEPIMKAPQGATARTKVSCKICTRRLPGSGFVEVPFYRRPVMPIKPRIGRLEQRWWDRQCIENRRGRAVEGLYEHALNAVCNNLTVPELSAILQIRSKRLARRESGSSWSGLKSALTADNIKRLPRRQVQCLLLVVFLDMTRFQAAQALELSEKTVEVHLARARQSLANRHAARMKSAEENYVM